MKLDFIFQYINIYSGKTFLNNSKKKLNVLGKKGFMYMETGEFNYHKIISSLEKRDVRPRVYYYIIIIEIGKIFSLTQIIKTCTGNTQIYYLLNPWESV